MIARLVDCCAFLVAFAMATVAVDAVLPTGGDLSRGEVKLQRYQEQADRFDLVFLGSSRTFRGFDPAVFDARCAERGLATSSFNFGVHGAYGLDLVHFLERIVREREPAGPASSWVLIDPEGVLDARDSDNLRTPSVIAWHDIETTSFALEYVASLGLPAKREQVLIREHLISGAYHLFNVARGQPLSARVMGARLEDPERFLGAAGDGYFPLDLAGTTARESNDRLRAEPETLRALARSLRQQQRRPLRGRTNPFHLQLFERVIELCRQLGAVPVFVLQPGTHYELELVKAHDRGQVPHLIRLDQISEHPEFFDLEHRWDYAHLSRAGAERFSSLLADEFVGLALELQSR